MGWFRHQNFRLARLCGIQSKVSQENFAKAWHQQGHQVETTRWLDEQICRGKPSPMKLPLIKGCRYDDRIGWSGHPVFSFILGLVPTIREIDFRSSKINEAGGFGERRRLGGAPEHKTKFWPKAIEFTFLCSHVSSFSMWTNHNGVHSWSSCRFRHHRHARSCWCNGVMLRSPRSWMWKRQVPCVGKLETPPANFLLAYHCGCLFARTCKGVVATLKRCQCHVNAGCSWETLDDVGDLEHQPIDDFIDSDRRFCWKDSIKNFEIMWRSWVVRTQFPFDYSTHCLLCLETPDTLWIPLRIVDSVQEHARI